MKLKNLWPFASRNGVESHPAPTDSATAALHTEALSATEAAQIARIADRTEEESPPTIKAPTVLTNPNPRRRDEFSNVLWRSAWVDLTVPTAGTRIEDTAIRDLYTRLEDQGRGPSAAYSAYFYNEHLLEMVRQLKLTVEQSRKRVETHNDRALQANIVITRVQKQLLSKLPEAVIEPKKRVESSRRRADRAHTVASLRAGAALVRYQTDQPEASIDEYRARAEMPSAAAQTIAEAKGKQEAAEHLLKETSQPTAAHQKSAPDQSGKEQRIRNGKKAFACIAFGLAAFSSIMIASGLVDKDSLLSGEFLFVGNWMVVVFYLPMMLASGFLIESAVAKLMLPKGDQIFRNINLSAGKKLAGIALGVATLIAAIDAAVHSSGFLRSAVLEAGNTHQSVDFYSRMLMTLMALFLVIGFVLYSGVSGLMAARDEARREEHLLSYEKRKHVEWVAEKQQEIAEAKALQQKAIGVAQAAPLLKELLTDKTYSRLVRACNRARAMEAAAQQAQAEEMRIEKSYTERILALEGQRVKFADSYFSDDVQRIEEVAYSLQFHTAGFLRGLRRLVHDAESPWLIRWLRRWSPLWEWFWVRRRL